MTDPFRPDDELVSAVLDGEATPEERARVEADPVLSARLAEFTAVRDAVAEPVAPPSEATRERAIEAAKVLGRELGEPASATVRPLKRRSRSADLPRFLAVAAAILLVLVTFGALASVSGDDSGEDSASDALSDEDSAGDDASGAAAEGGGESSGDTSEESAAEDRMSTYANIDGSDLGEFDSSRELADALRSQSADDDEVDDFAPQTTDAVVQAGGIPQAEVGAGTRGGSEDCQVGLVEADNRLSGLLAQADVDYAGQPAVVYVYGTPEGRQRVLVVTVDGCRTLAAFDL